MVTERKITVRVFGRPRPQGSKDHVGGGRLVESSPGLPEWRERVAWAVRAAAKTWRCSTEAVVVTLVFYLAQPRRNDRLYPTVPPDIDKLARGVLDALQTSGAIADDAQVCDLVLSKRYCANANTQGVEITLQRKGQP
jgi:crossover junction endodeoxyribonuclease RusA